MEHKFRFGIQISKADSAAEWVAKAKQIEDRQGQCGERKDGCFSEAE